MVATISKDEGWADLTRGEMSSTDPSVVARIQELLTAALGHPVRDPKSFVQRKALNTLSRLTMPVILNRCSMRLKLARDHPDVTELANRVFGSHACGQPFIRDTRYKTWLEIWQPEKGPFLLLVSLTAKSRTQDWIARTARDPDARHAVSSSNPESDHGAPAIEPSRPDMDFEFHEIESHLESAIDRLRPGKARDAIRARVCRSMTAKEYAADVGINENTAHMQMTRGAEALRNMLVHDGLVTEGFGRNIISLSNRTRKVQAKLASGMKLGDLSKEGANERA